MTVDATIRHVYRLARVLSPATALISASVLAGVAGCSSAGPVSSLAESTPSARPLSPPVAIDAAYKTTVETHIAGTLHLTVARLRSELRGHPGPGLEDVAKPLGIAEDQLARIILSGLDGAADAAGRSGKWTASQVHTEKMYWANQSYATLVTGASSWLADG